MVDSMSTLLLFFILLILPCASSATWPWNANNAGAPPKIKPKVIRPSGPTNVTLFVVSRTELGVTWGPPLYDGGKAISKYLVEWDTDKYMTSGIASPSNPYENGVDGPLVRSEVVWDKTEFRITGLIEGQKYYVRVSAYGDGYSHAISTNPLYAIPSGTPPGYLTDVSLSIALGTGTADRLRLAWSAAEFDVNGFSVLPKGCAGGETPPSSPDAVEAYRVRWDTHPSLSNPKTYDIPAVSGDGVREHCCPSGPSGVCQIELGAEIQTVSVTYPMSSVPFDEELFDSGSIRIAYVGSQSKSIKALTPAQGSSQMWLSPAASLSTISPIKVGDVIRINSGIYLVSNVDTWPEYISLSTEYQARPGEDSPTTQAYFSTPPQTCFDVSGLGNSAENFRAHIAENFDNSPFNESITVSRSTLITKSFASDGTTEKRIVGYEYHVTFIGQGFSSTIGHPVEDLIIMSKHSSPFSSVGSCSEHFVSSGFDVSGQVSLQVSTKMESGSIIPGQKYYVQVAGVNAQGVGPYVPSFPESETPRSLSGLAQNCRVYALPTSSSSLKVEWDGVQPYHGQQPSSYRVEFYDVDITSTEPVASHVVDEIDESSQYSITVPDLVPGVRYKVLIVPVNELGEGGPDWFAEFDQSGLVHDDEYSSTQNYLERSCHAVPTCETGSIECTEAESGAFVIVARSIPPPPSIEVGTYSSVSDRNRFSAASTLVSFLSPLTDHNQSTGMTTDKFRIEWSTGMSFRPTSSDGSVSSWSAEVVASFSDGTDESAYGEYMIDSLKMGAQYFVRVFAHNSAGFGNPSIVVPVKPATRPDPPYEPVLSSVTDIRSSSTDSRDSAIIGTSLSVSWQPPRVDSEHGRPDMVGNGGDPVSSYLVEWSRVSFDSYNPTIIEMNIKTSAGSGGSSASGLLYGSFRLIVDTTLSSETAVQGIYTSASIPVGSSVFEMKTILENIPNIGEVNVHSPEPFSWIFTFLSEVGDVGISVAENDVEDDSSTAGIIEITRLGVGSLPANAAYGFEIIDNIDKMTPDLALHYSIKHLVPGMALFVRVSAGNRVGFGPRRKTAPEFISPALQRPDIPTSLYSDAPPYLSVRSPTSLEVHIGPPTFDGGSPLTTFFIEWDPLPTFSSSRLGDGSALGSARVNAASRLCSSCVSHFNLSTNTFAYNGDEVIAKLLIPQRKIMVYFSDDKTHYLFSIVSVTASTITVSNKHLRVLPLHDMKSQDGVTSSNLEIIGTRYIIDGLLTGTKYYVRVSSENGQMGTGKSVSTAPHHETPRGFPLAPGDVTVSVTDKHTLSVSWSNSTYLNDPDIKAFKVERFCKSDATSSASVSFFGEKESVEFSTVGLGLVGGTFTVYFGGFDSLRVVVGHAKATNSLNYIETLADLTPHLQRGESIMIGEDVYLVHPTEPFTPSRLPLSESYHGINDENAVVYARSKSMPLPFDASAEELQNTLEQMPYTNHVQVRREVAEVSGGYRWFVTFSSNVGPQPAFSVDTTYLVGANPSGFTVTRSVTGTVPDCYLSVIADDPTATTLQLHDLVTGKPYYIRVASISDSGESEQVESIPTYITPGGVPDPVAIPHITPLNENTLLVTFETPPESNGAVIDYFFIDSSRDPSFSSITRIVAKPDYKVQRITTRAHSIPWDDSSSFTLSLGDFHGDFTIPISGGTTVSVLNGGNTLIRTTGFESLSSFAARGDYIVVGGSEFRVCLSTLEATPHDDSHLSLCSKNNPHEAAIFSSDTVSNVINELPIFRLDTSLGAATSPAVGDMFLITSQDTRTRLRRGDLVRVGHPESGETFRVSTDKAREFNDRIVPLSVVNDPMILASLSQTSLQHSTYEVQSFYIRSNRDSVTLTPSNTLNSGYRIRFKLETTRKSKDAGSSGCLKWDGSAHDLQSELESLAGIDAVQVTKHDLPAILGGAGAGVQYFITFTGDNVRGNVPPLQIVDVGTNGCLDASDLGGVFKEAVAPIVVEQVEIPYIPFYEVQTTVDIPYDASGDDLKAAIESLSQACTVNVSRRSTRNGYSWDVTFIETKESTQSPLLVISANGANLSAVIDPSVSAIGLQHVEVPTASAGAPYFIRVAAVNSFGEGPFVFSNPRAMEVSPQPPTQPIDVFVEAMSDTELLVQWNPPLENGGRPITHYKVEYDRLPSFTSGTNSGPYGSTSISSSSYASIYDVQLVTVKIDNDGWMGSLYLSGTFSLSYDGQTTRQLPYNASPEDLKDALQDLCNVDEVSVSRSIHCSSDLSIGCMTPDGFTWLVTFLSVSSIGDQHRKPISNLSANYSHKLSADGSYLFECTDVERSSCSIGGRAAANVGTTQEIQQVTIGSSPFSVTIRGETSDVIMMGDSIPTIEAKLNSYSRNGVGKILVTCPACVYNAIAPGDSILLHFLSFRGDLPPIIVSDPETSVSEVVRGKSQLVVGRSTYFTTINGLTSISDWHVRVFAYNGVGEGFPGMAWPSPIRLTSVAPQIPEDVTARIQSATSLVVSWNRPSSIGGVQLSSFIIEHDTIPSFTSQNGLPLGQMITAAADADTSLGIVVQAYPNSIDPILRKRIIIGDSNLISDGDIGVGSEVVIEEQRLTVVSINDASCGINCLSMDQDYSGTALSGMKIYSNHSKHYSSMITNLVPGHAYFIRVAARNERAIGPFAYVGGLLDLISSTPMDVPTAISWALVTPVSSDKLRVDFGPSVNEKPEGVNGSPVSKYQVDLATGLHEIQVLRISSSSDVSLGSFGLTFRGESTGCVEIGSSKKGLAMALESLSTIDKVSVSTVLTSEAELTYKIEFLKYENQPPIEINSSSSCTQALDDIEITVQTLQDGVAAFRPEIITLSTSADEDVSGFMELSAGYQGKYEMLIAIDNQPANFMVVPGSLWVHTPGNDLTPVLLPGETFLIEGELVTVGRVRSDGIELKEYHLKGTNGNAVFGYRMDNYVGAAVISRGATVLNDVNGHRLDLLVKPGDSIQIFDETGTKLYLTVLSVSGSSLQFSPSYAGNTVTTPIYARKRVVVPASSSSAQMKTALQSLPDIGSVEVTREGPNASEGYTWYITFTSNVDTNTLLPSTESISYIVVNGLGQDCDGHYILTSFEGGRPRYDLLGKSCYIVHDIVDSEWKLFSRSHSLLSSVAASDITVPTTGWSNGVLTTPSDGTPVTLLAGEGATVEISILQSSVDPSFENIVFSTEIDAGNQETQELELSSPVNDIGGSFELALGRSSTKITVYFDESAEDLTTKLQSLPGVGCVRVERAHHPIKYGFVWSITFLNFGDVPLLRHFGSSALHGTGVTLDIREATKGTVGERHIIADGLEAGQAYAVRVRALNDLGYGPHTTSSQKFGSGVLPVAGITASPPGSPNLSSGIVAKSRAEFKLTMPSSNGSDISSYKFEWSTANSFDSLTQAHVRLACSDGSEILGSYMLVYGSDVTSRLERTVPIQIKSNTDEISQAMNSLTSLNEVGVSSTVKGLSELEWIISFLHDVGNTGVLSVDSTGLRCQSENESIESAVLMLSSQELPADYGSEELIADDAFCGSVYLAEFSPVQYLTLSSKFGQVLSGSYQLTLDSQSTECIQYDASEDQIKTALEGLKHVISVEVAKTPALSGFPYSYKISFIGSYAYGDWPALTINPAHFGTGSCDSFVGGSSHNAKILPVRDESLCFNGIAKTVAIVADSMTTLGGTFTIQYGIESSQAISFDTSATEMEIIIQNLTGIANIKVSKHSYYHDMNVGMAWAVAIPRQSFDDYGISAVDTFVTGKNARVHVYPVLKISSFSSDAGSVGDFRIIIGDESTAPISHHATQQKILRELHRLNGIGKVTMLGPRDTENLSPLQFIAMIDDSLTVQGLKALAIVGDITTAIAPGDKLNIGNCYDLVITSVEHESFDSFQSAGYLYESLYSTSSETEEAKLHGYSILIIKTTEEAFSFTSNCSQANGVAEPVSVGSALFTETGVDHTVIVKSHTADLDTIKIIPESNWRGTAARLFFQSPAGLIPQTFILKGMRTNTKYIVRASAKNAEGYGPPSNILQVTPTSTAPSAPISVFLT
ncbi:hypothetical protein HJC23_009887 [Cyclotella cryptica]|uniref:Fibronectin type-III domain-containing protein n=1 Tax=Cyclotella cryptica TaxID=29204 RepID=A0ABD3QB12_9STRA|eukprot:CCRYP_007000-RA/>CCRYP_007000-RA protein AED:0.05 eAED:0.05 QI:0/-1/0/1/-1/1/1/0/4018